MGEVGVAGLRPGGRAAAPDPFTIYTITDCPIYRPGHTVRFKATVRERLDAEAPGGFLYRPYAHRAALVEIRDGTDALLSRRTVMTNAFGSLDGDFRLAAETTLGRWQIVIAIGDFRAYATFQVQEYRKPEYITSIQFDQAHYPGGTVVPVTLESRYYFGQPVARAAVTYTVGFQPQGIVQDANMTPEAGFVGHGLTDAQGRLRLEICTQRLPFNRTLQIRATIVDLSRRQQQVDGNALITAGRFTLSLEPGKAVYRAGEHAAVTLHAADYDGKPVPTRATVRLIETKYDREWRPYRETIARQVTTDAAGRATTSFPLARPGYLELEAEAFDNDGSKITSNTYLWVAGDEYVGYEYPVLNLTGDRGQYRSGEVATILLNTSLVTPPGT